MEQQPLASRGRPLFISSITFAFLVLTFLILWMLKPVTMEEKVSVDVQATPASLDPTALALERSELENDKLRLEIAKLQRENQRSLVASWAWNNGVALVAGLVGLFGIVQWMGDRRDDREKRSEERFKSTVEGLGSEKQAAQVQAAVILRTFLRPGYEHFYVQVFNLSVANLRLQKPPHHKKERAPRPGRRIGRHGQACSQLVMDETPSPLVQALATVFRESFPRARDWLQENNDQLAVLDAAGVQLANAHLSGSDLSSISMPKSNLAGANLEGTHLLGANFAEAILTKANLDYAQLTANLNKQANLIGTNLTRASIRSAELEGAVLEKADLTGVDLTGTNLTRAILEKAIFNSADLTDTILVKADLTGANLEDAKSLKNANIYGVIGLTEDQHNKCLAKGAIIQAIGH